jgi:curved DNA-binding protein CbpA
VRDERQQYYELLGVAPGASAGELKAAHRDLVKVWHPDRFSHDPRLQQKAQEKLKEINEAYDLLSTGRAPRPAPAARASEETRPPEARGRVGRLVFAAILVLAGVYFAATRAVNTPDGPPTQSAGQPAAPANNATDEQAPRPLDEAPTSRPRQREARRSEPQAEEAAPPDASRREPQAEVRS